MCDRKPVLTSLNPAKFVILGIADSVDIMSNIFRGLCHWTGKVSYIWGRGADIQD